MSKQATPAPQDPGQVYYTVREVAAVFGKCRSSGYNIIKSLELPTYQLRDITYVKAAELHAAIDQTQERTAA